MRTINLNGYIDEEVWYGDEITPLTACCTPLSVWSVGTL